jgi:hypothetical protein
VDKQTGNRTNKHIKKFQVQEQQNFILSSSGVTLSASNPGQSWCRSSVLVLPGGWEDSPVFFPFSGSCIVNSSLSKVWLVLRFRRSALWPTSCSALELGFCCVVLLGACFFSSYPCSEVRDLSAGSLLSECYAGLLTVFQLCSVI